MNAVKSHSIKQFLILSLLAILAVSFSVMFFVNRYLATIEIDELYDAQLAQTSRMLQGFVDRPIEEIDFNHLNQALQNAVLAYSGVDDDERSDEGHGYEGKLAIQIWNSAGKLLLSTPTAPTDELAPLHNGYSLKHYDDCNWYVFSRHLPKNDLWIMLAERSDVRSELIDHISLSSFGGLFAAALLMGLSLIVIINRGLQPLVFLSAQLGERHIDKLEPIKPAQHSPRELQPLITAINSLMARVAQDLERERRFLGDVAHELRTPLSALKLNAQLALSSQDLAGAQHNLRKVLQGVDRSTRLIEQLLTLARLDPRALGPMETINLGKLIQEVVQTLSDSRLAKLRDHSLRIDPKLMELQIQGYPVLIGVMLRNLLENASRYSAAATEIAIEYQQLDSAQARIVILDQGPGVPEDKLHSLCNRFFREHPADRSGSGLGLSIVARIADIHSATLAISNRSPQGLRVQLDFAASTEAHPD
jgi:two-component system, OmpR family, sensor histidine kinase QseC